MLLIDFIVNVDWLLPKANFSQKYNKLPEHLHFIHNCGIICENMLYTTAQAFFNIYFTLKTDFLNDFF